MVADIASSVPPAAAAGGTRPPHPKCRRRHSDAAQAVEAGARKTHKDTDNFVSMTINT
jgi:hypothetical protein